MSVLIKGMEMPKSCSKCGFFDMGGGDGYRCTLLRKSFEMWNKISVARDRSCPLIEVPTPHGRLIDADALIADLVKYQNTLDPESRENARVLSVKSYLTLARGEAIIEAEEGE